MLEKRAVGIETIEIIQHKFPTTVIPMLFQAPVSRFFGYSALFLAQITLRLFV